MLFRSATPRRGNQSAPPAARGNAPPTPAHSAERPGRFRPPCRSAESAVPATGTCGVPPRRVPVAESGAHSSASSPSVGGCAVPAQVPTATGTQRASPVHPAAARFPPTCSPISASTGSFLGWGGPVPMTRCCVTSATSPAAPTPHTCGWGPTPSTAPNTACGAATSPAHCRMSAAPPDAPRHRHHDSHGPRPRRSPREDRGTDQVRGSGRPASHALVTPSNRSELARRIPLPAVGGPLGVSEARHCWIRSPTR